MAATHAEVIFVAGPQRGQRAAIRSNVVVAGRSPEADLQLGEPYVSRQQLRLTFTTEGWVVEGLSDRPIRINDKKFKKGKKVIVETGDVIGAGAETEMLFVAQGDEADEVLAAYRATRAAKAAEPAAATQAAPEGQTKTAKPERAPVPEAAAEAPPRPATVVTEGDRAEESPEEEGERKAKLKKYGLLFGAYVGLLAVLAVVIAFAVKGGGDEPTTRVPRRLKPREIKDVLTAPAKPKVKDLRAAAEMLSQARAQYQERAVRDGSLYKSLKYFKLHLAYKRGQFDEYEDEKLYEQVKDDLVRKVQKEYKEAIILEKNKQWQDARLLLERLLRTVPAKDEPEPEDDNLIFENVTRHLVYVKSRVRMAKEKGKSPY